MFKNSKKNIFSFGVANAFFMTISFLLNLIAMKFLLPSDMGKWQLVSTISVYLSILTFGIINGIGREIPVSLGKNNQRKLKSLYTISLLDTTLLSIVFIFVGITVNSIFFKFDTIFLYSSMFYIISVLFQMLFITVFRSFDKLKILTKSYFLMGIITLFIYPAVKYFGLNGFVLIKGLSISFPVIIMIFMFIDYVSIKAIKKDDISELVKVGFPIMLVGISFQILSSTDRYILAYFFDTKSVGYYSLSIYALTAMAFFPKIVTTIFYPKMGYYFGRYIKEKDNSMFVVIRLVYQNLIYNLLSSIVLGSLLYLIVPILVRNYLVKYVDGISAMKISIIAFIFLNIGLAFGNYLNVIKRQKEFLFNILFSFIINFIVGVGLAKYTDLYINSVAYGTLVSFVTFAVLQFKTFIKNKNV